MKKNLDCSVREKRPLIDPAFGDISLSRQCELLGLSRSGYYYQPLPASEEDLLFMNLIDEQYTLTPYYGVRRMTAALRRMGHRVNHKRVARLLRTMGIEAIYPKPRSSSNQSEHIIHPYLLRNLIPSHSNEVWAADITYIRMHQGFLYLVAIMDWYSRYVVSFQISNTLETSFCLDALETALERSCPEIFNTDQGVQFTSEEFTSTLKQADIRISMDGKGRVFDNIFVERLWRSVKYEEVYLNEYRTGWEAEKGLSRYFRHYNEERPSCHVVAPYENRNMRVYPHCFFIFSIFLSYAVGLYPGVFPGETSSVSP